MSLLNTGLGLAPLHPPGVRWPPSLPWQCPGEFCPERGLGREDGRLRETACEAAGSLFLALLPLPPVSPSMSFLFSSYSLFLFYESRFSLWEDMVHTHNRHYPVTKENEIMPSAATRMHPETPTDWRDTEKDKRISYMWT